MSIKWGSYIAPESRLKRNDDGTYPKDRNGHLINERTRELRRRVSVDGKRYILDPEKATALYSVGSGRAGHWTSAGDRTVYGQKFRNGQVIFFKYGTGYYGAEGGGYSWGEDIVPVTVDWSQVDDETATEFGIEASIQA